jgi:hypothetical protein
LGISVESEKIRSKNAFEEPTRRWKNEYIRRDNGSNIRE